MTVRRHLAEDLDMFLKNPIPALCVLAVALGLAGCGGGGSSSVSMAVEGTAVADAVADAREAVADGAIRDAAALLEEARRAVADSDLSASERAAWIAALDAIEASLDLARDRHAVGLRAALDGARIAGIEAPAGRGAAPTFAGTVPGTGQVAGLRLEEVAGSAVSAMGWDGRTFAATGMAGVADRAVYYTDFESGGTRPFSELEGLEADGNLKILPDDAAQAMLIASSAFPDGPGRRTHMPGTDGRGERRGQLRRRRGKLCLRAGDGERVHVLDPPRRRLPARRRRRVDVRRRHGARWCRARTPNTPGSAGGCARPGRATPSAPSTAGRARRRTSSSTCGCSRAGCSMRARRWASTSSSRRSARRRPASSPPEARLEVEFGGLADLGRVSGTVDGFDAGGERRDWTVALEFADIAADGAIGGTGAGTVWTIGGDAGDATAASLWSGRFHDVDADEVPGTATGTFAASYGDIGRLLGAFGAKPQ